MNKLAAACERVLLPGPMGRTERMADYRRWISGGIDKDGGAQLSGVATSCGVFVRGGLLAVGYPKVSKTWKTGQPIWHGWLPWNNTSSCWLPWRTGAKPEPGDVFFVQSPTDERNCHVGVFIRELQPGVWQTAEGGGGSDGTRCGLGQRTLGAGFDRWGRTLRGWWSMRLAGIGDEEPATGGGEQLPLAPPPPPAPTVARRTLRVGSGGDDVRTVQRAVGVKDDGAYGPITKKAVEKWQEDRGLADDGIWGPQSWAAYDREPQP